MKKSRSKSLFILGAGFTKAAIPDAPLNSDLVGAIIRKNPGTLEEYVKKYNCEDIEIILTRIDIELASQPNGGLMRDRKEIQDQIANYFTRYRFKADGRPKWLERFAQDVLKIDDSIISLNYDCYLEGALDYFHVWTPNGGYPKNILYPEGIIANPNHVKIYKIHGSENFKSGEYITDQHTFIQAVICEKIFPVSGLNRNYGIYKDLGPYIIAPSFVKIPHVEIEYMMLDLLEIAKSVDKMIIIGSGLRPEDGFLWLLITRFIYSADKSIHPRLIILDPSAEEKSGWIKGHCMPNVDKYADIVPICSKLEDGIDALLKELNTKN